MGQHHPSDVAVHYEFTADDALLLHRLATNTPRDEIAQQLGCSQSTIDRHLARLRDELHVRSTVEIVVAAVRAGVV